MPTFSEWMEIDTAPKDGQTVLVRDGDWAPVHAFYKRGGWVFIEFQHPNAERLTHWKPKPAVG